MFAVRGWAVPSAALKTQTQTQTDVPKESSKEADAGGEEVASRSEGSRKRKRKHSGPSTEEALPAGDLSDLWQEHIERKSKTGSDASRQSTKELRKSKTASSELQPPHKNGETRTGRDNEGMTSKPRKSSKDKAAKTSIATSEAKPHAPSATESTEKSEEQLHRKQDRAERKAKKKQQKQQQKQQDKNQEEPSQRSEPAAAAAAADSKLTTLQSTMRQKLISSRFRHLNESLYTKPSAASMELFQANPSFFTEYHDGFRRQVEAWPENPRDTFLQWIRVRGALDVEQPSGKGGKGGGGESRILWKQRKQAQAERREQDQDLAEHPEREVLPRDAHNGHCTIADLGCGEGQLGKALITAPPRPPLTKRLKLYVHSFDLASVAPHVTACDMRALPMRDESVDVAIFCLALMGTNWIEFVEEAYRVLRWRGELWISEVGSRFAPSPSSDARPSVVDHSVGKRRKTPKKKNPAEPLTDLMPASVDDEDAPAHMKHSTDVSAFVDVLRRRGFQLRGPPQIADKAMFVRMRFLKCLPPSKGKGVQPPMTAGGSATETKLAFIDEKPRQSISTETEAAVLKPCVYKLR